MQLPPMTPVALTKMALVGVGILLSIITLAVSAAATAAKYDAYNYYWRTYETFTFLMYRGTIAFAVLCFVWFCTCTILTLLLPSFVLLSPVVDVTILGVLFVIGLGTTGWSTAANGQFAPIGAASVAFGWLLTFLCLAILIFVLAWTLVKHGGSLKVWTTSIFDLAGGKVKTKGPEAMAAAQPVAMQEQPLMYAQQPVMYAQQPMMSGQPVGEQGGFVVQPSLTGTSTTGVGGSLPAQYSGSAYPQPTMSPPPQTYVTEQPQQGFQPAGQATYTVNLDQPGPSQGETRYTVEMAGPPGSPPPSKV